MGRWSAKLAPDFLRFACRNAPTSVLDIGCGTGSLLGALAKMFPRSRLVGMDPSLQFIERARMMLGASAPDYVAATAEKPPFKNGAFDCCLSLLVLQELRDRESALAEMHRVTRPGGIVAACQWNFQEGMPMLSALRQALTAVADEVHERIESPSPRGVASLSELESIWRSAGLQNIETARLAVVLSYKNFADLWTPILAGPTPTTALVAALPAQMRKAVGKKLKEIIAAQNDQPFSLTACAFAI